MGEIDKKDLLVMKLVHYFITEENYNPIVVNGVKEQPIFQTEAMFNSCISSFTFSRLLSA